MADKHEVRIGDKIVNLAGAFPLKLKDAIALAEIGILNKDGTPAKGTHTLEQMLRLMHHFLSKVDPSITAEMVGDLEIEDIGKVTNTIMDLMEGEKKTAPLGQGRKRS